MQTLELIIADLSEKLAKEILSWKYEEQYSFYNNELIDEEMEEICDGSYYAVVDEEKELLGFFCMGRVHKCQLGTAEVFIKVIMWIWNLV